MGRIIPTSKGQMEPFADHFRVIAVDTRGHGESPRGTGPFTLSRFAEDLKSFFDQHGISKCHLLGFSDGGNVALLFALKYPDRVEAAHTKRGKLGPVWRKAEDTDSHSAGMGAVPPVCPVQPTGKTKLGDAEFDGNPAAYTQGGAGGTGHAGSGSGGETGHDPREPHSVNRGQYPKQPVGHPSW